MHKMQHLPAFWQTPPASTSLGEVVLEVQFAHLVTYAPQPPDTPFEELHFEMLGCDPGNYAYVVKRVVSGRFDGNIVVVTPSDYLAGETLNPWATRILVGTVEEQVEFVWSEGGKPFIAPVLRHRPPPHSKPPSEIEEFFRNAETTVFFAGYLIQDLTDRRSDARGGIPWVGLLVLALLFLAIIALVFWLVRRLKRTPV